MNFYTLSKISRTSNLDSILILRQYKLHQMCKFLEMKSDNTKMTQKEISKEIGLYDRTVLGSGKILIWIVLIDRRQNPPKSAKLRQNSPHEYTK